MKRSVLAAVVLAYGFAVSSAQEALTFPQFETRVHKEGDKELSYRLLVPKNYTPGTAWPLLVWLHGSGEKGADNTSQLRPIEKTFLADQVKCPALVMVPQCPSNSSWLAVGLNKPPEITEPSRMVIATVAELQKEFGLDSRRIYIGGFSMGGCGTWDILSRYPDLFAGAFPIAGPPGDRKALAPVIKDVPIWVFHGDRDSTAPVEGSRTIVESLKSAGADVRYTEYPDVGHECARALADPHLTEWLLAHRRSADPNFTPAKVTDSAALMIKTLPDGTRGTWTGKVQRTTRGVPRLPIEDVRYRLKPAANADPSVADILAKIGKGEITDQCQITGTVELLDQAWLAVEKIQVKE